MLDQLSYNSKGTFLQNVHTIAILTYLAALLLLPLIFTHPLYLLEPETSKISLQEDNYGK